MKKTRFIAAILAGLWSSIAMQVSAQYGTDMTHLLTNPNFEDGTTGWTIDGGGGGTIATAANYGYSGTTFMESWVWAPGPLSDRSWHQTIDLPNGIYAVKAMAHAIMQNDEALTPEGVSIFANEDMVPVTTTYTNPPKEYHVFTQVTDGSLTVGLNITSCNTNWVAWDNVRILHYSSAQTIEEAKIMSAKDEMMALIDKATTLSAEVFADAIAKAQDVYDNATDYDIIVEATNELQGIIIEATPEGYYFEKGRLIVLADISPNYPADQYPWESQRNEITSVEFTDGVILIGSHAFEGCENLTSITIPASVTSLGAWAFCGCSSLSSIDIPASVTSIGSHAFYGCSSLSSVTIPEESKLTSLGIWAFYGCSSLSSIDIPASVTSIEDFTFHECESLTSITIPENANLTSIGNDAFSYCSSLSSIDIPASVTSIGSHAFYGCSSLSSVTIPEESKLTSLGESAFSYCSSLSSIDIPASVTSIGELAFHNGVETVYMHSTTPPTLTPSALIDDYGLFVVPESAYDNYCSADYWKDEVLRNKIITQEAYRREVTLTANNEVSALYEALGETTLSRVADLTINGSINSHDFFMMLTKMTALRHLDLTNASIVYNKRTHYESFHTEDNIFPACGLYNCNLLSIKLPKNITSIGSSALANNYIKTLEIPESVTKIEYGAFSNCTKLTSVSIPKGVIEIGGSAFYYCTKLTSVSIPKGVIEIGESAFYNCSELASIILPPSVEHIGWHAFAWCDNLKEVRIPSSVRYIEDEAFGGCTSLKDIYTYTIEPIAIGQNTFPKYGNNFIGTLHAPKVSYANYYNDTQWGQYLSFEEFDEPYENFYLVGDKTLNENTGSINGTEENAPDAEMGENSGIIVEDDVEQDLGDVEIEHNGTDGGSIIVGGEGCVNADKLHFHINVQGGRWYFFCFPFDVKREDIKMENGADWVFRYYDGEERANNGQGGWKNVTSDGNGNHLKAATGYIFQCSQDDVLILTAKNQKLKHEKKYNELVEHVTENMQDASWNFVGNPYLSYYEVTSDDYSAPITVWRDGQYVAIRPGDDDYQLAPFEAFFVQKPTGVDEIEYSPEQQMTYHQAQEAAAKARARRREMPINPERLLVNITLTDGTNTDRTRVVFNNDADMGYETTCDAAKFSTAGIPQLYTVDSRAVKYAINERPVAEGIVTMGYTAPAQGNYTLAAPRMDTPIYVKDNLTGTIHDFSEGSYTFMTEAGTYEGRFTIMMKAGETAIDNSQMTIDNEAPTYNVKGQRVENATEQGIYIKDNRKVVKL